MIYLRLIMSSGLELLIQLLKYINTDDTIEVFNDQYNTRNPIVNAALHLANEFLIGDDGHPDRDHMNVVIEAGFSIYPGEMDRFGWVTGCIELSKGIIVFG